MITFETQEDFEQAVVHIIKTRLIIGTGYGREPDIYLSIHPKYEPESGEEAYVPDDDKFTSTDLPTPSLRY